jgi:hypothetical protein
MVDESRLPLVVFQVVLVATRLIRFRRRKVMQRFRICEACQGTFFVNTNGITEAVPTEALGR